MPNTIFHGNVEKWRLFHAANMTDREPTTWSEGADIGIGVEAVEKLHHVHHPVAPDEFHRTEFLAVWEKNIDCHRGPIGDGQIADEFSEGGDVI